MVILVLSAAISTVVKDELSCCCDGVDDGGVLSTEERESM